LISYNQLLPKGYRHSEESKKKMSKNRKGKGGLKGSLHPLFGKHRSEDVKKKLSRAHTGKKLSEEHKKKLSELWKGEKNPFFGKHHSEETLEKMRGRKVSEESKKKMSRAHTGKKLSEEHSRKIALANTGKKRSEDVKKKMSEGKMGEKNPFFGKRHSPETKKVISEAITGVKNPFFGKRHSEETIEKLKELRMHIILPKFDTTIEKTLQGLLKRKQINFEKHKPIFGQPDIFIKPNICIFADGNYWHGWYYLQGKDYSEQKKFNNVYFENKIRRDGKVTKQLAEEGYTVLRFWESEIKKDPEKCLKKIINVIKNSKLRSESRFLNPENS